MHFFQIHRHSCARIWKGKHFQDLRSRSKYIIKGMLKAVIFDFDGTIADTEPFYESNILTVAREYGISCDDSDLSYFFGRGPNEKFSYLAEKYHVDIDVENASARCRKMNRELFPKDASDLLFDDVLSAMKLCQERGLRIFVCSNTDSGRIRSAAEDMGILTYIDEIFGKDRSGCRKPSSGPYEYILKTMSYKRDEVVAIEDSKPGVNSAMGAQIKTVGLCRKCSPDQLKADVHIDSLYDLSKVL